MKVLVVHAHPDPDSFGAAIRNAVVRGLRAGRHDVTLIDLEAEDYQPCLTRFEHDSYTVLGQPGGVHHPDPVVQRHIAAVLAADALIVIYPTFWSGLPAVLDGWIERTMLPGVVRQQGGTWRSGRRRSERRSERLQLRLMIGVSTYGSPRSYRWIVGDGGRRTLRMVRRLAGRRCRFRWLALDTLDSRSDHERETFLLEVEAEMAEVS